MTFLLSQLVEAAAQRDPDRDAFRSPTEALTYGQLTDRANRLARLLVDDGVRRGDRVGIFMPRCVDSALAVHGILRAGAAFVPLDPLVPPEALRRLLEDCGIRHVVTHRGSVKTLHRLLAEHRTGLETVVGPAAPPGLDLDPGAVRWRPWTDLDAYDGGSGPDVRVVGDDPAYIMYSSGSTGRPKGILHTHRSGLAYARLSVDTYDVNADDRIGNHSPLHFDMSTFGYFSAPLAGATTVLIPEAYTKLTASLSQLIEGEGLTIWYSVPLALIQLLTRGVLDQRDHSALRWVLFGGEPFARKHLYALMAAWPNARFSNVYGPAEVNQCTFFHVPRPADPAAAAEDPDRNAGAVPIGRIWDDTEGRILGDDDRPVDSGRSGELVIRSSTMMRGYWDRPDLDARAFYRETTDGGFKRTFYRTGDLVQRQDDGELMFLGRKDRQLKVRGYRLELDDIERTLSAHDAVEEAAVFPVRRRDDDRQLAAAASLKPGTTADAAGLRAYLADQVSSYAVPSEIRIVDAFPRTTSGKIDRRKLQEAAEGQPEGPAESA
ncbi:MAG: amino acid adenylation domain-containing protein [Acidobacteriota bacterium]